MSANADPIEACFREVVQARNRVSRMKVKQVTNTGDRDYLKSVAYSWFKSHRPLLVQSIHEDALETVDVKLRAVLDATAHSSAKTTYLAELKNAKDALSSLRNVSLVPARSSPSAPAVSELPPDFTALASDPVMKAILESRWAECQRCIRANAHLAATVMMGGLLEALFVARANRMTNKAPLFRAKATPMDSKTKKPLVLPEWTLRPYIDVAAELGWISRSGKDVAGVLRDYRNYIHPEKERAHGVNLNDHDPSMFWEVTKSLARQLLSSVSAPVQKSQTLEKPQLTDREKQCLLCVWEGKSIRETSQIFGASERTIHFHLENAARKLNVGNLQHAAARSVSLGLIVPVQKRNAES